MNKIKIYVIARISQDFHGWTDRVVSWLGKGFEVFMPKDHNPWNSQHESFSPEVVDTDMEAIRSSDIGLMLPEYGRDCAWEAGWYAKSDKLLVVFIDDQIGWLRDWMVKGGVDCVITPKPETYKILQNDRILKHKQLVLIEKSEELGKVLQRIYRRDNEQNSELPRSTKGILPC